MERRIREAALEGSVVSLRELLQEDALALDRFMVECYADTPLHVAAMLGHLQFVEEILHRKPELAGELNSRGSSPLHLAAAKGYLEVVQNLVRVNRDMCSRLDQCGRNPLHIAAMKGHVDVLRELIQARPEAAHAETERGEMILQACVRFNKLEAMKFLVESIKNHEFLNSKDCQGNTILHLAVIEKQIEKREKICFGEELFARGGGALPTCQLTKNQDLQTIKFLTSAGTPINVNALNANGFTALDISTQIKREVVDWEIEELLRFVGAKSGKDTELLMSRHHQIGTKLQTQTSTPPNVANHQNTTTSHNDFHTNLNMHWIEQQRGALMIVATVIATIAFQVGVNPPGGVWQENKGAHQTCKTGAPPPSSGQLLDVSAGNTYILGDRPQQTFTYNDHDIPPPEGVTQKAFANTKSQRPGHSIMADNYPIEYAGLLFYNTIGLLASLSITVLLISGLPFKFKFLMWLLMFVTWAALTAMALTYGISIGCITPQYLLERLSNETQYLNEIELRHVISRRVIQIWVGLLTILLLLHTIYLIWKTIACFFKCCRRERAPSALMV